MSLKCEFAVNNQLSSVEPAKNELLDYKTDKLFVYFEAMSACKTLSDRIKYYMIQLGCWEEPHVDIRNSGTSWAEPALDENSCTVYGGFERLAFILHNCR